MPLEEHLVQDSGNGKTVSWSFTGKLMGIKWKYIGVCVDQATGMTTTSVKNSRGGSVEHCLREVFQKLSARQELLTIISMKRFVVEKC